jgi:prolyl oligopeptidase
MENGGVYAVPTYVVVANTEKWHDAGTKMQKQNVFDDFIAEYLIAQKYTLLQYLAIRGGSNGLL